MLDWRPTEKSHSLPNFAQDTRTVDQRRSHMSLLSHNSLKQNDTPAVLLANGGASHNVH